VRLSEAPSHGKPIIEYEPTASERRLIVRSLRSSRKETRPARAEHGPDPCAEQLRRLAGSFGQ
jgi:hypothetical protein